MKKICLLSGMMVLSIVVDVNAMEEGQDFRYKGIIPETDKVLDALFMGSRGLGVRYNAIDWPAVFAILDSMQGVINVNEYYTPVDKDILLVAAIQGGKILAAKTLLEKYKANPNQPEHSSLAGRRPLMFACENNDLPMVKLLLLHGADPNLKDVFGRDCFYYAGQNTWYARQRGETNPKILEVLNQFK